MLLLLLFLLLLLLLYIFLAALLRCLCPHGTISNPSLYIYSCYSILVHTFVVSTVLFYRLENLWALLINSIGTLISLFCAPPPLTFSTMTTNTAKLMSASWLSPTLSYLSTNHDEDGWNPWIIDYAVCLCALLPSGIFCSVLWLVLFSNKLAHFCFATNIWMSHSIMPETLLSNDT